MKIETIWLDNAIMKSVLAGEEKSTTAVGFAYDADEEGVSCPVFMATRKDGTFVRTKKGAFGLNVRTAYAKKKGDHEAQPAAQAEAQPEEPGADIPL